MGLLFLGGDMTQTRRATVALGAGLALAVLALSARAEAPERSGLLAQKEKQKQIQAETEVLVRRVLTTLRVLERNRAEGDRKDMLEEIAGTLSGLSKEQMVRLIAALEAAQKAQGEARTKELRDAQDRHEEIVLILK